MTPSGTVANRTVRGFPLAAGAAGIVLGLAAIAAFLWYRYGIAVFYEVFLAGIANCF